MAVRTVSHCNYFACVFVPTDRIYKPLFEKKKTGITWIPNYFYLKDGKFLPIIAGGDFVNLTVQLYESKKNQKTKKNKNKTKTKKEKEKKDTYLSWARDVDRRTRSRPGRVYKNT